MTQKTFNGEYQQMAYVNSSDHQEPYHFYAGNSYGHYISDSSVGDESNFWSCSPRSDSPSPNAYVHSGLNGPYSQNLKPITYSAAEHQILTHRNGYTQITMSNIGNNNVPFVRVVKRRSTANKKERRRTQSINNAYADLRDCIPNVPADTKLSKIKTLRLATSYISYLTKALESDNPAGGFKAELANLCRKSSNNHVPVNDERVVSSANDAPEDMNNQKKAKGRTGWPQHVWALELKQEQTI